MHTRWTLSCGLGLILAVAGAGVAEERAAADRLGPCRPDAVVRLWPGAAPGLVAGGASEVVVNERFTNVSEPELFVYLPPKDKAVGTALIICAGGAYHHLAMGLHVENVAPALAGMGVAVFGLKYRTRYGANRVEEDALADARRAVRLVRSRAKEWGLDPARVGVLGYSAGAHVCLNLAARFDEGDAAAADPIDRISSRPDFVALICPWPNGQTIADFPLHARTPPVFIAHARDDRSAPFAFAVALAGAWEQRQIPHRVYFVDTGGHSAFHYGVAPDPGGQWPTALAGWLRELHMLK